MKYRTILELERTNTFFIGSEKDFLGNLEAMLLGNTSDLPRAFREAVGPTISD